MIENHDADNYCPLDEDTLGLLAEISRQIQTLNGQLQGVLRLYVHQHKLSGRWEIADNGRELRRLVPDSTPNLT